MRDFIGKILLFKLLIFALSACDQEIVPEVFQPRNDHEAYLHGLEKADLLHTALGRDWLDASNHSLEKPVAIALPYQEVFYISPQIPQANGYVFSVRQGQKILVNLDPDPSDSIQLFIDVFRLENDEETQRYHIATADKRQFNLGFEPREDGRYQLRIQPELLRGGRFQLTVQSVPSLDFPVETKDKRAIGSFFGDPRDGGRRRHHGIDIFARRHTPVIAPTDGYIRFAGERGLGGRVVWMRDPMRDMTLYFAHLEEILVDDHTRVEAGDTLGTVGNSGNAKTTPPHLHFGIYRNGPIDPYYFVTNQSGPKNIRAKREYTGSKVRTRRDARLELLHPDSGGRFLNLARHQLLEVRAAFGDAYRVELPGGIMGAIKMEDIESIEQPIRTRKADMVIPLLELPAEDVAVMEEVKTSEPITILAEDTSHWYVRTLSGKSGWIEVLP